MFTKTFRRAETKPLALMFVSLFCCIACSGELDDTAQDTVEDVGIVVERRCPPPEGFGGSPTTIAELVEHLNRLPMPVTIPCLLESLDRPLSIYATWNTFSAQPALSPLDPRLFIFRDSLILSVVTSGDARYLLEMGDRTSATRSVKAEIKFPMTEAIALTDVYDRVGSEEGTNCAFCHLNATRSPTVSGAYAYESDYIPGEPRKRVELDYMRNSHLNCDAEAEPDRCDMYNSIFSHGEVVDGDL